MARPIEFEYIVETDDPQKEYDRLLSARPNEAAIRTLKDADALDLERLELEPKGTRAAAAR
jgi:hypothetical protein